MAQAEKPGDVVYICGIILSRADLFDELLDPLAKAIGQVDQISEYYPFDMTAYYEEQMGGELVKRFVSFIPGRGADHLARVKVMTNEIEAEMSRRFGPVPQRPVNLDPGYITESKLVLASMKDFSHRVYLSDGVYGEVTSQYHRSGWGKFDWTFPDFASGRYDEFLSSVRDALRSHMGRGG